MNRTLGLLATSIWLLPTEPMQEPRQLAPFQSIETRNGAHVTLIYAPTQRVNLVRGSLEYSRVAVTTSGTLVIDKCTTKCSRGYELEVEVFVSSLKKVTLEHSGWIKTRGDFPRQGHLTVAVAHGGNIDVRSMRADTVTASVDQGGGIMTVPQTALFARVAQGGAITYWGDPAVMSSVEHGGVVTRGLR